MSVRSLQTPGCSQAVRRQILATSEGLWVSDSSLSRAFERYCAVSPAARRHVSFVPGPLESRRRLGRRHMAELYSFQSHASLPPWALNVPTDLGRWNWQAPTSPEDRLVDADQQEPRQTFASWTQLFGSPSTSSASVSEWSGLWSTEAGPERDDPFLSDMDLLVSKIRTEHSGTLPAQLASFLERTKRDAADGSLTTHHLYQVLNTIPGQLFQYGHPESSISSVYEALCCTIGSSEALRADRFEPRFWNSLLAEISLLNGRQDACKLFKQVMLLVPKAHLEQLRDSVSIVFASLFQASAGLVGSTQSPRNELPFQQQATDISRALSRFSLAQRNNVYTDIVDASIGSLTSPDSRPLRVFWLSVLARTPSVPDSFLFESMEKLFGNCGEADSLSDSEICKLLTLQWACRGYFTKSKGLSAKIRLGATATKEELVLAQFARAICKRLPKESQTPALASLCQCLRTMGRLHGLGNSFESLCQESEKLGGRALASVAAACHDVSLALRLHEMTTTYAEKFRDETQIRTKKRTDEWDWRLWLPYLEELVADPSIDARKLRALLEVKRNWVPPSHPTRTATDNNQGQNTSSRLGLLSNSTVYLLEKSAERIATCLTESAPGRLDRTALHLVETRIRYLKNHGALLGPRVLRTLAYLLTRDLANGEPGRNSRVRWLLQLIASYEGPEAAVAAESMLGRWRMHNRRAWLVRRREETRQTPG